MEILPCKFLKGIPVGSEILDARVKSLSLGLIVLNLFFHSGNFRSGLNPADEGIARTEQPQNQKNRQTSQRKSDQRAVSPAHYVFYLAQN